MEGTTHPRDTRAGERRGQKTKWDRPAEEWGGNPRSPGQGNQRTDRNPRGGGDRQQEATPKKTPGREEGAGEGPEPGQGGEHTQDWGSDPEETKGPTERKRPEGRRENFEWRGTGRPRGKAEPGRTFLRRGRAVWGRGFG